MKEVPIYIITVISSIFYPPLSERNWFKLQNKILVSFTDKYPVSPGDLSVLYGPIQGFVLFHILWLTPHLQTPFEYSPGVEFNPQTPQGTTSDSGCHLQEIIPPQI